MTPWEKKAVVLICLFSFLGFVVQQFGLLPPAPKLKIQNPSSAWVLSYTEELSSSSVKVKPSFRASSQKVNVNKASVAQLQSLSGVGPKTAMAIVLYRQKHGLFSDLESLQKVKGIGSKKWAKIAHFITLD